MIITMIIIMIDFIFASLALDRAAANILWPHPPQTPTKTEAVLLFVGCRRPEAARQGRLTSIGNGHGVLPCRCMAR